MSSQVDPTLRQILSLLGKGAFTLFTSGLVARFNVPLAFVVWVLGVYLWAIGVFALVAYVSPQPRLVGVEPNPGPDYTVDPVLIVTLSLTFYVVFVMCVMCVLSVVNFVPKPRLVGIETNPGPVLGTNPPLQEQNPISGLSRSRSNSCGAVLDVYLGATSQGGDEAQGPCAYLDLIEDYRLSAPSVAELSRRQRVSRKSSNPTPKTIYVTRKEQKLLALRNENKAKKQNVLKLITAHIQTHFGKIASLRRTKSERRTLSQNITLWRSSKISQSLYVKDYFDNTDLRAYFLSMKFGYLRHTVVNGKKYYLDFLAPVQELDEREFARSPSGTWYAQSGNDRLDHTQYGKSINKLKRFQQHPSRNPVVDEAGKLKKELIIRQLRDLKYAQMNVFGTTVTHDLSPQLEATIGEICDSLNNLTEKLNFKSQMSSVVNAIEMPQQMSTLLKLLPLYVCTLAYVCTGKGTLVFKGTLCTVGFLMLSSVTPTELWETLKERVQALFARAERDSNVVEAQMSSTQLKDIVSILFAVTTFTSVNGAGTGKKLDKFMSSITDLPKKQEGIENTIVWMLTIVERLINFIRVDVLELFPVHLLEEANRDVASWISKIESLSLEAHKGELFINTLNADRVFALVSEGNSLMSKIGSHKEAFAVRNTIVTYQNALKKLQVPFDQANISGNDLRMSPICVLLRGASGVGKSTITVPLILEALGKVLPVEQLNDFGLNHMDFIYNRQPEHVFWDGYRGQFCTIFDDFGQARDVVGTPDNEFMNLIRCGNSFPNTLHMAEINSKGVNNFRSKFVFCSTNMRNFNPTSIIEPEAVMRRFDLIIDVVPKVEFCLPGYSADPWSRRLDRSAVSSALDTSIYEFLVYSFREDRYVATVSYGDIVSSIVAKYEDRTREYDEYRSRIGMIKLNVATERVFAQGGDRSVFEKDSSDITLEDIAQIPIDKHPYTYVPTEATPLCELVFSLYGYEFEEFVNVFPRVFQRDGKGSLPLKQILSDVYRLSQLPDFVHRMSKGRKVDKTTTQQFHSMIEYLGKVSSVVLSQCRERIAQFIIDTPFLKYVGIVTVMIGCITAAFKIVSALTSKPKESSAVVIRDIGNPVPEAEYSSRQRNGVRRQAKPLKPKTEARIEQPRAQVPEKVTAEGGADKVCDQLIDKITSRNVYEIYTPSSVGRVGFATFVVGRLFIMPRHFVLSMKVSNELGYYPENPMITLKSIVSKIEHSIPLEVFLSAKQCTDKGGQDLVMCEAPKNVNPHSDITKNFLPRSYSALSRDYFTKLVVLRDSKLVEYCSYSKVVESIEITSPDETFVMNQGYQCDAPTSSGDCGSLLYLVDPTNSVGKIIGSHSAGDNRRRAYSTSIFYEDIVAGVARFEKQVSFQMEEDRFAQLKVLPKDGSFVPLFQHDLEVRQPVRNKVTPSLLCGSWGETKYAPSALTRREQEDGSFIYPMDVSLSVYANNVEYIDQSILDVCGAHYLTYFLKNSDYLKVHKPCVYSFEIAVAGQPGVDFCEGLSRGTSAGFPWCVTVGRSHKGKSYFFGANGEFDFDCEGAHVIKSEVESIIDDARHGRRQLHIYTDNLKDEKRKIEKVALAKTRLFSGCPLGLQIATRMYFLDFSMAVMRNKIDNGIAVGINVYSEEWQYLAQKLRSKGEHVIAGDFSGYDGSLQPQVLNVILDIINAWYDDGEENKMIRTVLWCEVFASRHINGNKVYEWSHSLPSGHVLTVIINSIYDHIAFRYAWINAHNYDCLSLASYNDNVYCIAYGDDNVLNISDYAIDFFNQETMPHLLSPLGLVYTNELKNGVSTVSRKLTEVSFLKRMWRFENNLDRFIAPLALDSILEMPYWTKDGPMFQLITEGNVDKCVEELALHDKQTFDVWFPRICRASKEVLGHQPSFTDYQLLQLKCLSCDEIY